jgi:hypothetical protein
MRYYNVIIVAILVIALGFVLYAVRKKNENLFRHMILALVIKAEKYLGSGTGSLKYSTVVRWIYEKIPLSIRGLFTQDDIDNFIEWSVDYLKDYLKDGHVNLSGYDDEVFLKSSNSDSTSK